MNERVNDCRELIPYAASYPVQVQAAGRQLSIAAQLTQDIERARFVAILKQISPEIAVQYLSNCQALEGDLIERFVVRWDWCIGLDNVAFLSPWKYWYFLGLSNNEALPWSLELLESFAERWDWGSDFEGDAFGLSTNEALPWSLELIECFADRWNWFYLSSNKALPWSLELLERFADRWNWSYLSSNEALPWSLELLERIENRWAWCPLSNNIALPWSLELLERFEDSWDWNIIGDGGYGGLANNEALPWSFKLITRFSNYWDWEILFNNKALHLPLLRSVDNAEIMSHHFPKDSFRNASLPR